MKTIKEINEFLARAEFGEDVWLEDELVEWEYGFAGYNHAKKLYTDSFDSQIPLLEKHLKKAIITKAKKGYRFELNGRVALDTEATKLPEASARALVAEIELREKK